MSVRHRTQPIVSPSTSSWSSSRLMCIAVSLMVTTAPVAPSVQLPRHETGSWHDVGLVSSHRPHVRGHVSARLCHDVSCSSSLCPSRQRRSTCNTVIFVLHEITCSYRATSNYMKLVHWPLLGGQRGGDWAGPQPAQVPPRCTKCNSPPINGQCTNYRTAV